MGGLKKASNFTLFKHFCHFVSMDKSKVHLCGQYAQFFSAVCVFIDASLAAFPLYINVIKIL